MCKRLRTVGRQAHVLDCTRSHSLMQRRQRGLPAPAVAAAPVWRATFKRRRHEAHPRGGTVDVVHFVGVGGQVVQLVAVCRQEGREQGSVSGGAGWRPAQSG